MSIKFVTSCILVAGLAAADSRAAATDVQLADGHLVFRLPDGWIANPNNEQTGKNGEYMYGRMMKDAHGNPVIPSCTFLIQKTSATDVVKVYAERRASGPELMEKGRRVFTYKDGIISLQNAVGIKGSYPVSKNVIHDVILVDALDTTHQLFVETVCEAPTKLFPRVEGDFRAVLGSMQFN